MPIFVLGLNHHKAPLAVRERVAFQPENIAQALSALSRTNATREAAILSTCNRTELICVADSSVEAVSWLSAHHAIAAEDIAPYLYVLSEEEAIRHLFRVACGLDSMVLGEAQILGQLKDAARSAEAAGALGSTLHKLFQAGFAVAKDVRTHTGIGANVISMAAAAVRLSEQIFERMSDCRVLFVGAGEMIELCATHFVGAAPRSIALANRTLGRAQALAEGLAGRVQVECLPLARVGEVLSYYDVVVSCTGSPLPIIGRGMVERALKARRRRPMVMVDLAVPRDMEPEIAELSDVFLYTVDDLSQIVSAGIEARQAAVQDAERMIEQGVINYQSWLSRRDAVPTIRALREHGESLRQAELQRAQRLLARGEDPLRVLEQLATGLTNKLLHAPSQYLGSADEAQLGAAVDTVRRLYRLDVPEETTSQPPDKSAADPFENTDAPT